MSFLSRVRDLWHSHAFIRPGQAGASAALLLALSFFPASIQLLRKLGPRLGRIIAGPRLRHLILCLAIWVLLNAGYETWGQVDSNDQRRAFFWLSLILFLLGWLLWAFSSWPTRLRRRPFFRGLELIAFNALLLVISLEILLLVVSSCWPDPLLWQEGSVTALLKAFHRPHELYFGFPTNSGGYYDEEFFAGDRTSLVMALLGDSFAYGIVPYSRNFVTIAEGKLQETIGVNYSRVAIHNFGTRGIGMPQYSYLLAREVEPLNPCRVILSVFVGNDIERDPLEPRWRPFRLVRWKLPLLLERLFTWFRAAPVIPPAATRKVALSSEFVPPYIDHPEREEPTFSKEAFLNIERKRLLVTQSGAGPTEEAYRDFFVWLDRIRQQAGDRLVFLLIPDEFQVNDDLWAELLEEPEHPGDYRRDLPQTRILDYANRHAIPTLDLLPLLRASRQRPYHLRDTHFNGTGNRIAGEALGAFLFEHPGPCSNPHVEALQ